MLELPLPAKGERGGEGGREREQHEYQQQNRKTFHIRTGNNSRKL